MEKVEVDAGPAKNDHLLSIGRCPSSVQPVHRIFVVLVATLLLLATTKLLPGTHLLDDYSSKYGLPAEKSLLDGARPSNRRNACDHPRFIFLGDSTMLRTALAFQSQFLYNCQVLAWAGKCDFPAFYGIPYDRSSFNDTIPENYGPTGKRGCQDCSGCESRAFDCSEGILEFHGVEFAADYEYPTANYALTQESVVLGYLLENRSECDFVAFNTGLHDTATTGTKPHLYKEQLEYYLKLLLKVYDQSQLLWVTTTHPVSDSQPEKYRDVTSSNTVFTFNQISRELMTQYDIDFLDVAKMSMLPKFKAYITDGVHVGTLEQPWYQSVAFSIFERATSSASKKMFEYKRVNPVEADW